MIQKTHLQELAVHLEGTNECFNARAGYLVRSKTQLKKGVVSLQSAHVNGISKLTSISCDSPGKCETQRSRFDSNYRSQICCPSAQATTDTRRPDN
jgi:hypothetical protein